MKSGRSGTKPESGSAGQRQRESAGAVGQVRSGPPGSANENPPARSGRSVRVRPRRQRESAGTVGQVRSGPPAVPAAVTGTGGNGAASPNRYRLKRGRSFFAAGEEFGRALQLLGDGAFKLFAWVCLRAERATGRLAFERAELARALGRSRRTLRRHLAELAQAGVCELEPSPNQHRQSVLRVRSEFWPYVKVSRPREAAVRAQATDAGSAGDREPRSEEAAYLASVRRALLRPSCVQSRFSPADERLALAWYHAGVRLRDVERAIQLGSVRKTISMVNWKSFAPVVSLRYFANTLREVQDSDWPPGYWQHVGYHFVKCEEYWQSRPEAMLPAARPNLSKAQAGRDPAAASERKENNGKQDDSV